MSIFNQSKITSKNIVSVLFFTSLISIFKPVYGLWNSKIFIPYIDITLWPTPNIAQISKETGIKYFKLAFITANAMTPNVLQPAWAGIINPDGFYETEINELRKLGGDVCISFGGAAGEELGLKTTSEVQLAGLYQTIIDQYKLTCIDFDIEGSAVANVAAHNVRNKALNIIRKNNPNLHIAYCLPVMPDGLDNNGISVLKSAKTNGFVPDAIDIMAMDYGSGKDMGDHAITAAQNTHSQAKQIFGFNIPIGVIPMIGLNDVAGEIFTLADATKLLRFAQSTNIISSLSMWSITRDKTGILGQVGPTGSGIQQFPYQFSQIFLQYQTMTPINLWKCKRCKCTKKIL